MSTRLFVLKKQEQQAKQELFEKVSMPVLNGILANPDNKDAKPKIIKNHQPFTNRGSAVSRRI